MKRITLTRKGFREWLEGKPGKEWTGWSNNPNHCPIATYLRYMGMDNPDVGARRFGPSSKQTPWWARQFIFTIDKRGGEITARQALAVLDGKEAGA